MGTNNIISKAHRNKAQQSFQPVKAQRKMRNFIFLISEAHCNFRNELFDSVEAQRNSAIAERHFHTKLAQPNFCNWNFTTQCKYHIFCNLRQKRANNLLKKVNVNQNYYRNGTELSFMYRIALLTEKIKIKRSAIKAQQI